MYMNIAALASSRSIRELLDCTCPTDESYKELKNVMINVIIRKFKAISSLRDTIAYMYSRSYLDKIAHLCI